jgi:hypothetical protein
MGGCHGNPYEADSHNYLFPEEERALAWAALSLVPVGTIVGSLNAARAAPQAFGSFSALKRALGPAGRDMHWHHLVEQRNVARFGSNAVHSLQNVVRVDASVHRQINAFYSSVQPFTGGQTVRQWLSGQSFEAQMQFGLETLERLSVGP